MKGPTLYETWLRLVDCPRVIVVKVPTGSGWAWQHETADCTDDAYFPTHAEPLAAALRHAATHKEDR